MSLDFEVFDLDFPAGSPEQVRHPRHRRERGAAGRRRLHPRRRPPPGRRDPRLRQDADHRLRQPRRPRLLLRRSRSIADAFPDAAFAGHPDRHRAHPGTPSRASSRPGPRSAPTCPPAWSTLTPLDRRPRARRATASSSRAARPSCPTGTTSGRPSTAPSSAACWSSSRSTSGSPTPRPRAQRAAWIDLLDEMQALDPQLVVPGHRLPGTATDACALHYTRDYLLDFERILAEAADGAAATAALVERLPGLRHADRRPARPEGRQGRDDVGLTDTTESGDLDRAPRRRTPAVPRLRRR